VREGALKDVADEEQDDFGNDSQVIGSISGPFQEILGMVFFACLHLHYAFSVAHWPLPLTQGGYSI